MGIDVRVDVDALAGAEDTCLHRIHNYTYTKGKGVSIHMTIIIYYISGYIIVELCSTFKRALI